MAIALLLLLLALVVGGVGLLVEAFRWVVIVALALLVVSAAMGTRARTPDARGPDV